MGWNWSKGAKQSQKELPVRSALPSIGGGMASLFEGMANNRNELKPADSEKAIVPQFKWKTKGKSSR
jgi:hypothetical protein